MALTNPDRVGRALEQLNAGLRPFLDREMEAVYGPMWQDQARQSLAAPGFDTKHGINWDTAALLTVMSSEWNTVFKKPLGHAERSLVNELRDTRNRWAHQTTLSTDDVYRALDSMQRLLTARGGRGDPDRHHDPRAGRGAGARRADCDGERQDAQVHVGGLRCRVRAIAKRRECPGRVSGPLPAPPAKNVKGGCRITAP